MLRFILLSILLTILFRALARLWAGYAASKANPPAAAAPAAGN